MALHLIWPGELLLTNGTGKDLSLSAFVIEERVALKAVFVLKILHDLNTFTLDASVSAVRGQCGVTQ